MVWLRGVIILCCVLCYHGDFIGETMNNDKINKELDLIINISTIELMYHDAARHTVELEHKLNFARLREQHLKDRYVKLLCDLDQLRESVGSDVDDVQDVRL